MRNDKVPIRPNTYKASSIKGHKDATYVKRSHFRFLFLSRVAYRLAARSALTRFRLATSGRSSEETCRHRRSTNVDQ